MGLRHAATVALAVTSLVALAGCEPHTVAIDFDPEIGDRYRLRSVIDTEVSRTIQDETTVDRSTGRLLATERIVDVGEDDVEVEVTVVRDGAAARTYEARFGRTGRLSTIVSVEGLPTDVVGVDLAAELPSDIASPPAGRLEPGTTWIIDRRITLAGRPGTVRARGSGRIDTLGVEDGHEVAVAIVELTVPVRTVVGSEGGRVTLVGTQTARSETAYDLADGTARRDRTEIVGETDAIVEPPAGVAAPPVRGTVRYEITTESDRRRI